jgi:hypothetical protein
MAFTVAFTKVFTVGDRKQVYGTITPDSSWTAAGESLTKTELKLELELNELEIEDKGGYIFTYDTTNSLVKAYRQKDPAAAGGADIALPPVADSVDLSSSPGALRFTAVGKGSAVAV